MDPEIRSKTGSKKILMAIIAIFVLAIIGYGLTNGTQDNKNTSDNTQSSESSTQNTELQKTEYLSYQGVDGKTALELLKSEAEVEVKPSSLGDYVVSINGSDGGGSKFWLFYIDGKESSVGAGAYVTKSGETIEWKLQ